MKTNTLLTEQIFRCRKRKYHYLLLLSFFLSVITAMGQQSGDIETKLNNGAIKVTGGPFSYRTATSPESDVKKINLLKLIHVKDKLEPCGIKGEIKNGGFITVKVYLIHPNEPDLHKHLIYGTTLSTPGTYSEYARGTPWDYPSGDKSIKSDDIEELIDLATKASADDNSKFSSLINGQDDAIIAQLLVSDNLNMSGPFYNNLDLTGEDFQALNSSEHLRAGGIALYSALSGNATIFAPTSGSMQGSGITNLFNYLRFGGRAGFRALLYRYRTQLAIAGGLSVAIPLYYVFLKIMSKPDSPKPTPPGPNPKPKPGPDDNNDPPDSPEDKKALAEAKAKFLNSVIVEVSLKNATIESVKPAMMDEILPQEFKRSDDLFYLGADLSSVNEVEDNYKTKASGSTSLPYKKDGVGTDVYKIFKDKGSNLVRLRLWHNPKWTNYSNLADVTKGLKRAKDQGFQTLLDFHYSDSWADPGKQVVPVAWKDVVNNLPALSDSVYNYTKATLMTLYKKGLLPDLVQLGNEINNNIIVATKEETDPVSGVNFSRNATLLNRALQAVSDVETVTGTNIKKALHIGGGPHLADWWLSHHKDAGLQLEKVSIFGFSYYFYNRDPEAPGKAVLDINDVSLLSKSIRDKYKLNVMLMETGVPWTTVNNDGSGNMYGRNNLLKTYGDKPSPEAVKDFMTDLTYAMKTKGEAAGVIYWEPAWITSQTRASINSNDPLGSPYENAALFDFNNNANAGMDFYNANYEQQRLAKVNVTFKLTLPVIDASSLGGSGISLVLFAENDKIEIYPMEAKGSNYYTCKVSLVPRSMGGYTFIKGNKPNFTSAFPWNMEQLYWGIYAREYPVSDESGNTKFLPLRDFSLTKEDNQEINVTWSKITAVNNFIASFKKNYEKTTAINFPLTAGTDNTAKGNPVLAKVGDVLTTEWKADYFPYAENVADSLNKQLQIDGIPGIWIANEGGESRYYCSPSVRPGELNPWLGFDSQVHGTALRNYDSTGVWKFQVKAKSWAQDLVMQKDTIYSYKELGQVKLFRNWSLAREMDASKSSYSPSFAWSKTQSSGKNPIHLPDGTTSPQQRNNQREGLNMELLHAWSPDWKGITSPDNFASYDSGRGNKPKYILGTDPDELLYMNSQTSDAENSPPQDGIIQTTNEMWKIVPNEGEKDPVNDMVTAYRKNREGVLQLPIKSESPYNGYEVQDNDVSERAPDGLGTTSGNNKAPGADLTMGLKINGTLQAKQHFKMDVSNRLTAASGSRGFYGNILGTQWPAIWEKNVPYTLTGLSGWSDEELKRLSLELQYEDHRGVITQQARYLKDNPQLLEQVRSSGKWTNNEFYMRGWGYYTITAYYQYDANVERVALTGKELMDVGLRFVSNEDVPLKEGRGDGGYTYLDEFRSTTTDPFGLNNNDVNISNVEKYLSKHGRYAGKFVRTYTFKVGETSNFVAYDSDPHTFTPPGTEFYLSPRTRAKRIPDDSLSSANRQYLKYYIRKIEDNGNYGVEQLQTSKGKLFTKTWSEEGIFQLRVSYRDVSDVYHLIKVKNYKKEIDYVENNESKKEPRRGHIIIRPLNSTVMSMFNLPAPIKNKQWFEARVINVLSSYKYVTGPRASVQGNPAIPVKDRFGEFNDFADQYLWKLGVPRGDSHQFTVQLELPDPTSKWMSDYKASVHNTWFPKYWARHYNQKGFPPDFDDDAKALVKHPGSVEVDGKLSRMVNNSFANRPETWQVRLPWVAATTYSGYRIRTNIKPVYILDSLFSNYSGAFTGKAVIPAEQAIFLDIQNDEQKDKEEWYDDLKTGKRIVFQADPKIPFSIMAKNYFAINDPRQVPVAGITKVADSLIAIAVFPEVNLPEEPNRSNPFDRNRNGTRKMNTSTDDFFESKVSRISYLDVYPNPAHDVLQISFDVEEAGDVKIELFDMAGRQVARQQLYQDKGNYTISFDVSRLSAGAYAVKVITKSGVRTKKVIII